MFSKKCRKILLNLLAVLLLFLNLEGVKASAVDYENWMTRIGDNSITSDLPSKIINTNADLKIRHF